MENDDEEALNFVKLRNNSGNSFIYNINDLDRVCDEFHALVLCTVDQLEWKAQNQLPQHISSTVNRTRGAKSARLPKHVSLHVTAMSILG
jgi:hypothetical protein